MYMKFASVSCLRLLAHLIECALVLARESAGSNIEARIAMIAITTSSSIKVKEERGRVGASKRGERRRSARRTVRLNSSPSDAPDQCSRARSNLIQRFQTS